MLAELYIENIAVIKQASILLEPGLNVFTGETGAGKTILIGAINAVLGERTSRDIIRTGERSALVSARFEGISDYASRVLGENGYAAEEDGSLLVTREIGENKTSVKINGRPATVGILREIAASLISIHGQHDSGELLDADRHLDFIDRYGADIAPALAEYQTAYRRLCSLQEELQRLSGSEAEKERRMDLLRYQIAEIEGANLLEGEEESLEAERKKAKNAAHIAELLAQGQGLLEGGEDLPGLEDQLSEFSDCFNALVPFLPELEELAAKITDSYYEIQECGHELARQLEALEGGGMPLEEIEDRLAQIRQLKRKYGSSIPEILAFGENAARELETIEFSEERCAQLEEEISQAAGSARALAEHLTQLRLAAAEEFCAKVEAELAFLDMGSVQLTLSRREKPLAEDGCDQVEFLAVTNVGEEPRPLAKIASGGEISRMMLAIKNVMADRDNIDTLIFDEVDTGVSGKAAQKIGQKLWEVSRSRQVICVTHLAQVAAFAGCHLHIAKQVAGGRTFTQVTRLEGEQRVEELARIISGDRITPVSLENAREMLSLAKKV